MIDYLVSNSGGVHGVIARILIILLLLAPFPVLVGFVISPRKRRLFLGISLVLMVLGTALSFIAFATGETAMKAAHSTPAVRSALEEHRSLAQTTRELFSVLTFGFAALLFVPKLLAHELESRINTALLAIYLVFYTSGALFLVHTALQGGQVSRELAARAAAAAQLTGKVSGR